MIHTKHKITGASLFCYQCEDQNKQKVDRNIKEREREDSATLYTFLGQMCFVVATNGQTMGHNYDKQM